MAAPRLTRLRPTPDRPRPATATDASRRGATVATRAGRGAAPWMVPLLVVVTLFYLYPAIQVLHFSFTNASLLREDHRYGLESYMRVLTGPAFLHVVWITLIFVLVSIALQLAMGLVIALAVQHGTRHRLRGTGLIRTLVLTSWVMPGIVIGVIWQIVLNSGSYGLANSVLASAGLPRVGFLTGSTMALWSVIVANVWRGTAFSMILQYAGLQAIDPVLYEAAAVDGASRWQSFWRVTLPSLRPILMINLVLISIQTFNTFDMVLALTGGGPGRATEVLALHTYNVIFRGFSLGQGSVLAVVMLALSLLFTMVYVRALCTEARL